MFSYRTNPSSTFSFLEFVTVDGRAGLTRSTTVTSIGYRHEKSAVNTCPSAANEKIELRTTLSFCSYLWYESLTGSLPDVRQNRSSLGHLLGQFHGISIYFCLRIPPLYAFSLNCNQKCSFMLFVTFGTYDDDFRSLWRNRKIFRQILILRFPGFKRFFEVEKFVNCNQ